MVGVAGSNPVVPNFFISVQKAAMDKILLFIPCYNCENQIKKVLSQFDKDVIDYISEILVVDNKSDDLTQQTVIDFAKENPSLPLKLIENNENYNLGGSHKVAFNYAIENGFDYVIVLHGDDQASISDLIPLIKDRSYTSYDCLLGARFMPGSTLIGYSKFRTFGNIIFNSIFSLILFKKIFDLGSGLNIYNVKILKDKFYINFPDSLTFNCSMLFASHFYKHSIKFFPVSWREDGQVSNVRLVSQAVFTLKMLISYFVKRKQYIQSDLRSKPVVEYSYKILFESTVSKNIE